MALLRGCFKLWKDETAVLSFRYPWHYEPGDAGLLGVHAVSDSELSTGTTVLAEGLE